MMTSSGNESSVHWARALKGFKDAAVLQDNFYKPQLLRIHKETRKLLLQGILCVCARMRF